MIIKLDFDSTREHRQFKTVRLPRVRRMLKGVATLKWIRTRRSSSKKGWHVILSFEHRLGVPAQTLYDTNSWSLDLRDQLLQCNLQLLLGSDWKRELLYFMRILTPDVPAFWRKRSNILFTKKLRPARRAKVRASRNRSRR